MRQVVLDTETTGLDPEQGHRIIEIGGVELVNRRLTGRRLHYYLQPDRDIDDGALEVHGITRDFLQGKPRFAEVHSDILAFVGDAEVIIHNAPFDVGFIDHELARLGDPSLHRCCRHRPTAEPEFVIDQLQRRKGLADQRFVGQLNQLPRRDPMARGLKGLEQLAMGRHRFLHLGDGIGQGLKPHQ